MKPLFSLYLLTLVTPGLSQLNLGAASNYIALSVLGIQNNGPSLIKGSIGTVGLPIIGFPPGSITGTAQTATIPVDIAMVDALAAFYTAISLKPTIDLTLQPNLAGRTLQAGIYKFDAAASLTGDVILDAGGNRDVVWVFQIGGIFETAEAARVILVNGACGSNVYWAVGISATLGPNTEFAGNIVTEGFIHLDAGASISGGLYAGAAITLDGNVISPGSCASTSTLCPTETITSILYTCITTPSLASSTHTTKTTSTKSPTPTKPTNPLGGLLGGILGGILKGRNLPQYASTTCPPLPTTTSTIFSCSSSTTTGTGSVFGMTTSTFSSVMPSRTGGGPCVKGQVVLG